MMTGAGQPLSDKQMLPEIAALFFAGIDTTGHTGTWSLYMISQHPEVPHARHKFPRPCRLALFTLDGCS